jgi:hypothetical protein
MTIEDYKKALEAKLTEIVDFQLLEMNYTPYSFGSWLLAYRIHGKNYRLIYDGREQDVSIEVSKPHEKYSGSKGQEITRFYGLNESLDDVVNVITTKNI